MDQNFLDLLQLLRKHKVKYLVIGGYAVINYTEPRYTKDLDIWVECSTVNAKRVLKALKEFRAPTSNLSIDDLSTPGLIYIFGLPPCRIDILNRAAGATFATAWKNKKIVDISNLKVNFVDLNTLKRLKKKAGRPQDLADLEKLRAS